MIRREYMTFESADRMTDALRYELLRTREEFSALQPSWERIFNENHANNFYLSYDWFAFLIQYQQDQIKDLYIITVCSEVEAEVIAIIPCCLIRRRLYFFYHASLELIGNIYSPYRGCLVKKGMENETACGLVDFLMRCRPGGWHMINFENLSGNDPFISALRKTIKEHKLYHHAEEQFENIVNVFTPFPDSESYFRSLKKSFREPIIRHINMMNRDGGFDIILTQNALQDIERCMDDYYDIYARSWKKRERDPFFHRQLAQYFSEKGNLRIFILYINQNPPAKDSNDPVPVFSSYKSSVRGDRPVPDKGIPVAANYFILYGKNAYFLKTAYREDYAKYNPGIVSIWFSFKYLLDVEQVHIVDQQRGYEEYKIKFGGVINEMRLQLRIANPEYLITRIDLRCREKLIPFMRRVGRRVLGSSWSKYFKQLLEGNSPSQ
jgi:hypothetical protein